MTASTSTLADARARDLIATALDETLIVEAAAGTGKTTELVGRIVAILTEGRASVSEIVAVTFTEKAAGELKLRLRERLDAARSAEPDNSPRRALVDLALTSSRRHTSADPGFCADSVRERPVEAGSILSRVLTDPVARCPRPSAVVQEQLSTAEVSAIGVASGNTPSL